MEKFRIQIILLILLISGGLHSQVVPEGQIVDWTSVSYPGDIDKSGYPVRNVVHYGAVGDGVHNDSSAILAAIRSLDGRAGIIYFPPGQYVINRTLFLPDSVILQGSSPDSTVLLFDMGNRAIDCISVSAYQKNSFVHVTASAGKGGSWVVVDSVPGLDTGDFIEIRQENAAWDVNPASWARFSVGTISRVAGISGDTIWMESPLRMAFDTGVVIELRKITPRVHVGIECLQIKRLDEPVDGGGYNIDFKYAANCWVKGIESNRSAGSHVMIESSARIGIRGSYFHHAFRYDGASTRGYGVTVRNHAVECLIEDNIFRKLRHAMMVKEGANGNVFAYNYSIDPYRDEIPNDAPGDISLHGHYTYANLFEGNIVQTIMIDHAWGPAGPYNTFLRNRAERYGVIITVGDITTGHQNFIGNEITNEEPFKGNFLINGEGHFIYANYVKGQMVPAPVSHLNDQSYYRRTPPSWWEPALAWPPAGYPNTPGTGTIPARERFHNGQYTLCDYPVYDHSVPDTSSSDSLATAALQIHAATPSIHPNPFTDFLLVKDMDMGSSYRIEIYDYNGSLLWHNAFQMESSDEIRVSIPGSMPPGLYFIRLCNENVNHFFKMVKYR